MDKGPHIIPLVPGGVPVIIHASQGEHSDGNTGGYNDKTDWKLLDIAFKLLTSDGQYYEFLPEDTNNNITAYDELTPAELFYVRPDGKSGALTLKLARNLIKITNADPRVRARYSSPYTLFLRDVPADLTEVAGDVECEIVVYRGSNRNNRRESSANFIIRVEPKITAQQLAHYSIGGSGGGAGSGGQQWSSDEERNAFTPEYGGGDTVDMSLIAWADVVEEANNGDLTTLLTPGQEIRAVKLANGSYMGIRCIHVGDYKTAWFESKYLFRGPNKYVSWGDELVDRPATMQWASPSEKVDGYYAPEIIPYEIKSVSDWIGEPASYNVFPKEAFAGWPDYSYPDSFFVYDYYKTAEGRSKTDSKGVPRRWEVSYGNSKVVPASQYYGNPNVTGSIVFNLNSFAVKVNGDLMEIPINEQPPEEAYYVPLVWKLTGRPHINPNDAPVDIRSWQDVKNAAANGKLLNSNLQVGQLMPELPTVGVLRCVHITENWAAFEQTVLKETATSNQRICLYNDYTNKTNPLTEYERDIFTPIATSQGTNGQTYNSYVQGISGYNMYYASDANTWNIGIEERSKTLKNTRFDYYEGNDAAKRIKNGPNGTPVTYWGTVSGVGSAYTVYFWNTNGEIGRDNVGNSGRTPSHYVAPVFVIGNIE